MYIYTSVISQSSAQGGGALWPRRKGASLRIVFTASVSESSYSLFSFGKLNEAKLPVFALPMAAK